MYNKTNTALLDSTLIVIKGVEYTARGRGSGNSIHKAGDIVSFKIIRFNCAEIETKNV